MLGELRRLEGRRAWAESRPTGCKPITVHGDIRMQNRPDRRDGEVHIPHPGLRGVVRPQEGISYHDLAPDACSALAPERVTDGTPPTVASDLFACGCVWWHISAAGRRWAAATRWPACVQPRRRRSATCTSGRPMCPTCWSRQLATACRKTRRNVPSQWPIWRSGLVPCTPRSPGNRPLPGRSSATSRPLAAITKNSRQESSPSAPLHGGRASPRGGRGHCLAALGGTQSTAGSGERGAGSRGGHASLDPPAPREPPGTHHAPRDEIHHAERDVYSSTWPIVDPAVTPAGYSAENGPPARRADWQRRQRGKAD